MKVCVCVCLTEILLVELHGQKRDRRFALEVVPSEQGACTWGRVSWVLGASVPGVDLLPICLPCFDGLRLEWELLLEMGCPSTLRLASCYSK